MNSWSQKTEWRALGAKVKHEENKETPVTKFSYIGRQVLGTTVQSGDNNNNYYY